MIRFLFLLIVFTLGLGAAALMFGQMHHLRMAVPDQLPAWTEALPEDAGLRVGSMVVPPQGVWPATELSWQAVAPDASGLRWRVRLTGEDVDLEGDLSVSWWPDTAKFFGLTGSVALDALATGPVGLGGVLAVREGTADARGLMEMPVVRADLAGDLRGVRAGGAEFGGGPVTAVLGEDRGWQAEAMLDGGVSPVSAKLQGQVQGRMADLDVSIGRDQDLPTVFRSLLSQVGQRDGDGWRVTTSLPLF